MRYEKMKRNANYAGFEQADLQKLKKWIPKVDKAIKEVRNLYSINLSRSIPTDFANRFDKFSGGALDNLLQLWNMIVAAVN